MKSYKSESTVRPEEWDKTSSPEKVYHNQNIVESPATEDKPATFVYDVDEYEKMEYLELQNTIHEEAELAMSNQLCDMAEQIVNHEIEIAILSLGGEINVI